MSKGFTKRALSILLAGLMAASAGTVTAMAADPEVTGGPIKEYFSIGPRSVGLAIENIPEFAEYDEDLELEDEDGDGIYEGEFRNLISDFPNYDEVSFRIRLDGEWNDCWGAANEDGYTYGSETPVTVKIKDGETLKVSFDASNGEDYRHWTVSAYTTLSLDPEYEQLYIYAGDPEEDSAYIPLKDEDGDHIYEGYAEDFMLYGYNFVVNYEMIEGLNWYSDGNGNTQFGYGYTFKNDLDEGEGYKFYFDTNDPDYHNWHLSYKKTAPIADGNDTSNLLLFFGESGECIYNADECTTAEMTDPDKDGIYTYTAPFGRLTHKGQAYAFVDGYANESYASATSVTKTPAFCWGNDGKDGTEFGSMQTFKVPEFYGDEVYDLYNSLGMLVKYSLDTNYDDYHDWKFTVAPDFDKENHLFYVVGTFTNGEFNSDYTLTDYDGDGIYTATIYKPGKGRHTFDIFGGESWSVFWHLPYTDGITFATASSTAGLGENQTDIPVQVENDSDNIYISFDTTTGDLRTWLPTVEAGYRVESDELWAWFDGGEAEMTDENGDGIFEGVFDYLEPGTYEFGIGANADVWGPPNAEGITMNNEDTYMVELTVEEGEYVYVTFDTTGGNCEKYAVTYEVRKPGQALENRSTLGPDVCYVGDIIDVYGQAIGGTEPYKFKYSVVHVLSGKVMPTPEGFVSDRKITVKLTEYGEYDVKVQVMDADGNTTPDDYLMEAVALERPLENKSYTIPGSLVSVEKVNVGEKIKIVGQAVGGKEPYTYSYYYKRATNNTWKAIKTNTTSTSAALTPTAAAVFDIRVDVKDADGAVQDRYFQVEAIEPEVPLTNTSKISAETVSVGDVVTFTGSAKGGKAPYTFSYYYRITGTPAWAVIKENTDLTTASMPAPRAGSFDFKAIVKDCAGNTDEAVFTVVVTEAAKPLKNTSKVSATSVNVDDTVKITGAAEGGKAPYTFSYYFKRTANTAWKAIKENTTSTSANLKATAAASYDIKVVAKDSSGKTDEAIFTVVAKADSDMKNTSVINSDKVQVGDKVRIAASASGGTAPYTYAYYYKRSTNASWKKLGTEWGTNTSVAFAPTAAANYDIKVAVKDSTGQIVEKTFTVTAVEELELTNVSAINCSTLKLGGNIKLTGKAVGGKAPYTYSFAFKRATNTNWKTIGTAYSGETTAKVKPTAEGEYDLRVIAKDAEGTKVAKTFKVKVTK